MSVIVLPNLELNDENFKKLVDYLESENITFSSYTYIGEAFITEEVKFRVTDECFPEYHTDDENIVDIVSDRVISSDNLFVDVCEIIDEELENYLSEKEESIYTINLETE